MADVTRRPHRGLEQEVLAVLARAEEALTAAQVRDRIDEGLATNTVLTVLTRLLDKGRVTREPAGRGFGYRAVRERAAVTAYAMARLLADDDNRAKVLARFVDALSAEDEAILTQLLASQPGEPQ